MEGSVSFDPTLPRTLDLHYKKVLARRKDHLFAQKLKAQEKRKEAAKTPEPTSYEDLPIGEMRRKT